MRLQMVAAENYVLTNECAPNNEVLCIYSRTIPRDYLYTNQLLNNDRHTCTQ